MGDVIIPAGALVLFTSLLTALTGTITFLFRGWMADKNRELAQLQKDKDDQLDQVRKECDERILSMRASQDERISVLVQTQKEALVLAESRRLDERAHTQRAEDFMWHAIENTRLVGTMAKDVMGLAQEEIHAKSTPTP